MSNTIYFTISKWFLYTFFRDYPKKINTKIFVINHEKSKIIIWNKLILNHKFITKTLKKNSILYIFLNFEVKQTLEILDRVIEGKFTLFVIRI